MALSLRRANRIFAKAFDAETCSVPQLGFPGEYEKFCTVGQSASLLRDQQASPVFWRNFWR
jgi:hypothetical protein